ncbi:collagenase [Arsukibacterium ikkense]|uniref:collagenase n=1 Tax=Arsukibacterium ikkense TaxID=336831 RepID=UPI00069CB000|nr:collagenase [Arsukibacterium ikkense]
MKYYLPAALLSITLLCSLAVLALNQNEAINQNEVQQQVDSLKHALSQTVIHKIEKITSKLASQSTEWPNIEQELTFLRTFSYQHPAEQLNAQALAQMQSMLITLAQHPGFFTENVQAWRWQEQFSVLTYRYPIAETTQKNQQLQFLSQLSQRLPSAQQAAEYAWWEAIRAKAFLLVTARQQDELKKALNQQDWQTSLLALIPTASSWQLEHLLWLLAYQHILLPAEAQQALDSAVQQSLLTHPLLNKKEQKQLFSWRYLANSFRVRDNCEQEFADWCVLPNIEEALPHQHSCHAGLLIRYNNIDNMQLQQLCQQMMAQNDAFHQLLQSARQPVANDFNNVLEVIVFDDYSDYNLYGALYFNIHTNNGGMYIEGKPSDPHNQARFFAFQQFWQAEPFAVWNLQHEYVHYLDGRYNSYGAFGHFPSHKVWWSEGLAELIAVGAHNPKALALLNETPAGEEPALTSIFAARYQDGLDLTYRWSYLAWRFLQSELPDSIPALAQALRTDFFAGYFTQLADIAAQQQTNFSAYLQQLRQTKAIAPQSEELPYLGRYLYRSYLQPAHLPITPQHYHRLSPVQTNEERLP